SATPWIRVDDQRKFSVEAATEPYREFWDRLAALTGARVSNPAGKLSLHGTLAEPRGSFDFTADSASVDEARIGVTWPAVQNLAVHATASASGLQLDEFSFKIDGQAARASGRLPLTAETWKRLGRDATALDWRQADLHLQVDDAQLAP